MKLQAQAVLQRLDNAAPLRLTGVLVAGSFYAASPQEAWGPLHLEVGLVALAPLTALVGDDPVGLVSSALAEARAQWGDGDGIAADLAWRPIAEVRQAVADDEIAGLIAAMSLANDERARSTPSTPPYHTAARELERLASRVYEATTISERAAEDAAERRAHERSRVDG